MFSLRIVTTDHYQATPIQDLDVLYSDFRGADTFKVPVIRIYGSTPAGQKTCMHVHGVFPYLYVPYDGSTPWDRYLRLFATSVDKAINVAQGHPTSNIQHVFKISLVSGLPMYGYHDKDQQFLKIYLYNPALIKKLADLLLGGAVMNKIFQPHESHIPYTLQMFIDYNLYGMNLINVAACKFRQNKEDDNGNPTDRGLSPDSFLDNSFHYIADKVWNTQTIQSSWYNDADVEKQSTCELEVDVVAADILNRQEVDSNKGGNPGLIALWEEERQRKFARGELSQITPQNSMEHMNVEITDSDRELQEKFRDIVLELQPYMDSPAGSSQGSSEDSQRNFAATPASQLQDHLSQSDVSFSQETVIVGEEDDEDIAPLINVDSIQRVVSFSESFILQSQSSSEPASQNPSQDKTYDDKMLAKVLASLADDSSPVSSQAVAASQIQSLEEQDSILQHQPLVPSQEVEEDDEVETLEMSQRVWGGENDSEEPTSGPSNADEGFDLEGMDATWNGTQIAAQLGGDIAEKEDSDNEEDDDIPQLDGTSDEKLEEEKKQTARKRLGVTGPVVSTSYNNMIKEMQANNEGKGQLSNQSNLHSNFQTPTPTYDQSSNRLDQSRMNNAYDANSQGSVMYENNSQYYDYNTQNYNYNNSTYQDRFDNSFSQSGTENTGEWNQFSSTDQWNTENNLLNDVSLEEDNLFPLAASMSSELQKLTQDNGEETNIQRFSQDSATTPYSSVPSSQISGTSKSPSQETSTQATPNSSVSSPCSNSSMISPQLFPADYTSSYNAFHSPNGSYSSSQGSYSNTFTQNSLPVDQNQPLRSQTYDNTSAYNSSGFQSPQNNQQHSFSAQNVHQNNFSSPSNYGNGQFSSPEMQFNSSYNTQGQYSNSPQGFQNGMYPNSSENANGHYFNSQSYHQNQLYGVSPVQNPPTNAPTSFAQGSLSFSPTNMGQNLSGEINSQGSSFKPRNPTTKKREYKKRTMSLPGVPSNERISKGNTQTQLCGNSSVLRSNSVSLTHGNVSPSFCGANKPASTLENLLLAGNDNTFQTKPDGLSSPSGRNPASYPNPVTTRGLGNLTNMVSSLTHTQRPENAFNSVYGGNPLSSPPKHQNVANFSDGSCPQHTLQPGQNMINLNHYNPPAMGNNFGSCGNNQYASHPFARSLSVDNSFPMKPKRGRPSKLMMALAARARANSIPADIVYKVPERNPAYTFSFMIPNPILKKQRFINSNDPLGMEKLKSVRMHPQDARKYSLMKIGREIVKIKRLSETELIQFCNKSCNEQDHEKANNSGIPQSEMATDIISIDTDESSQVFYAEVSCFAADSADNSFLSQSSSVLSSDTEQVALPEESPTKSMESQELQRDLTPSPPILTPEVNIPTASTEKPLINSDNSKDGPNRIGFDIPSLGKSSCVTHSAKALHGERTCIQNESRINSSLNSKEKAADLREKDVEIPCFQAKSNVECSHLPVESEQNIFAQKSGGNNSIISLKDNESDQSSIQPVCDKSVDEQQPTQLYNKSDTQKSTPANAHTKKSIPFSSEEIPIQGKGSDVSGKRNSQKGKPQCCCSKEICSCSTQKLVDPAAETGPVSVSDVESEPVLSKGREHKLMDDRIKEESRTCSSDLNKCSANVNNGQDTPKKSCSFWNHLSFKSPSAIGFQSPHKQHVNGKLFEKEKINKKPSSPGASPKNEKINKKPVSPGTSPKNGYLSKSPSSTSLFGGNDSTKEMFFNIYTKTMKGPVSQAAFEEHYANFMQKYLSQNKPASHGNLSPRNNAKGIYNSTPASSVVGKHDGNIQVHKGSALPVPVLEQDISSKATSSTDSSRKYSRCLSTKKMQLKTNKFMEQVPVVGDSCAKDIDPMYKKRSWKGVQKSSKSTPGFQNDRSAEVWSSSLKSSCSISLKKVEEKLPVMKFGEERNIKCNKLFANVHMHDRQTSESPLSVSSSNASSRTTSRKDSSESYEEFPGDKNSVHKRIKRKSAEKCENENDGKRRKRCSKRNLSCKCEDFTTKKCNKVDSQTAEKKNQKDQKGKSQKKDVEIHYIITGRFKGFKKMMVELDNLDITEGQRISAAQFMNTSTFKSYLSRGKKNLYSSSKMTKIFSKSVTTSEDSCDKYDFKINKKKKISKNQQLHVGVAFQGRKHKKRKKPSSTKHSKLLNTLSVLHEATLANLNETTTTTCVTTTVTPKSNSVEDCHADYNDSLYKMALLSSSDSSKSDCSPPLANSPTGFFVDQNSQSRTTADVCSPSVSNSDGLSPSFQLSQTSPADCHNSSPSPVFSISQHNTHPFDPVISKSLDCAKKHFIEKQPSSSYIEGNKILDSEPFSATGQSENFRSDASSLSTIQDTVSQHNLTHTNFGSTSSSNNSDRSPIIPSTGNLCVIRSDEFSDISDDEGVPNANNITSPNDSMGDYSIILSPEVGKTLSPDLALGSQGVKSKSILEQAVSNIGVEATKGTSSDHITVTSQLDQTANKLDTKEEADLNQSLPSNNSYKESSKQFPNEHSREKERHKHIWTPDVLPPSKAQVQDTAVSHGLNTAVIQDAFCSNPEDLPEKPRELGGKVYKILSNRLSDLEEFESNGGYNSLKEWRSLQTRVKCFLPSQTDAQTLLENINKNPQLRFSLISDKTASFVPCKAPPSSKQVKAWLKGRELLQKRRQAVKEKASNAQNVKTIKEEKTISCVDKKQNPDDQQNITHEIVIKTENEPIPNIGISSTCLQEALHVTPKFEKTGSFPSKDTVKIEDGKDSFGEDSDDSGSSDRSEIISPSPPESRCVKLTNIKSSAFTDLKKKMSVKFASDSFSSKNSPDCHDNSYLTNKFHSSTPVMASPGALNVMRPGLKMSSALVHPKRLSALFGSPFTPIGQKSSQATDSCTEQVLTNSFVQSPNMPEGYTFPKETPADKPSTSETQNSLKTDSQLNQFATPVEDKKGHKSQIDAPTPQNSFGFKISLQNMQDVKGTHEVQNLTTLSIEIHAQTRGDLRPDPEVDPVHCLFYSILNDVHENKGKRRISGVIIVDRVSSDNANALKERTQMKQNTFGTPLDSSSAAGRSSPKPSTSQAYRSRSPSPRPSTPKRSKVKGVSPPPPRRFFPDQNIPGTMLHKSAVPQDDLEVTFVREELELFDSLMALVAKWDPDILVGYEIQNFSWGYLFQRAAQLSIPLCAKLSRIPNDKTGSHFAASKDEYGADHMSEIHIVGRIVLNLWRLLRHEVTLNNYTFENTTFHVLHRRIPLYSFRTLNSWFNHRTHLYRWKLIDYYMVRAKGNLQLIEHLDIIGQTSEFARVFGIEFYHVLSRGSQYRVESMMLRLAKPLNYIPVSPGVQQRAKMRAPECIPLTLEPESKFYADPVVVLDFQSLYPSIMIGHNYCFSTCLGRLKFLEEAHQGPIEFGCTNLQVPPATMKKLEKDITVSPNGVVFVKEHVRKGVISAMVEEILNTRLMVKKAMKKYKNDKGLHRMLDARQLGLKLIANVTYGYTAANFSGRMPCIEVGDSIVRKARETLERAIKLVEETPKWGARVVYGDTDSMFIELKGRSKEEAFEIGYEICDAVTATNPKPMKLKFEKVYMPCILQTKKRYVGFSYETPEQKEPIFDAKGIETVRRDACPAVAKILEKCVKLLFTSKDVSLVKSYVQNQCHKMMEGKVSIQDFIFAKEYRGMPGYKPGACVPALEISKKLIRQDRRAEPRVGERVPYVIVYGSPGLPLIQLVRQPMDLVLDPSLRLNVNYYITKQILPPLDRIFSLMGVNVFSWYNDMPKVVRMAPQFTGSNDAKKATISHFFSVTNCPVCDSQTNKPVCNKCMEDPQKVVVTLSQRVQNWDKTFADLSRICNNCMQVEDYSQPCISLDCPILFRLSSAKVDIQKSVQLRQVVEQCFPF